MPIILCEGKTDGQILIEVVTAMINQGYQCVNKAGNCCYSDGNGGHCGIGLLIPERLHSASSDAYTLIYENIGSLGDNERWLFENYELCEAIQGLHDAKKIDDILTDIGILELDDLMHMWCNLTVI